MLLKAAFIRRASLAATAAAAAFSCFGPPTRAAEPAPPNTQETAFLAENDAAMTKMMDDMAVKPSGSVEQDFVAMMAPHHRGAIEMAQAYLRYGQNEQLRRLAQEIIVEQQQEIIAMRLALGQPLPPSAPTPNQQHAPGAGQTAAQPTSHHSMHHQ